MSNKLNIIWIEDNPLLSERDSAGHDGVQKLSLNGRELTIPSMKSLQKESAFFNLKVLQHPEEIREYLMMCNKVVESEGMHALAQAEGVIPDLVVFDYMLSDNFNTSGKHSISYAKAMRPAREMLNPCYELKKQFPQLFADYVLFAERSLNYTTDQLFYTINGVSKKTGNTQKDQGVIIDDEFGLYAGISIVRFFKEHTCCGLPATFNKKENNSLQPTARYYEWLNGYDLEDALQRENKGKKDWKSVLSDGASLLRKRIEHKIKIRKVTPFLLELIELSQGKNNSKTIALSGSYGIKAIPLDALFIDVPVLQRDQAIRDWANELLTLAFSSITFRAENIVLDKARQYADQLWAAYQSPLFIDRLNLSKLHKIATSGIDQTLSDEDLAKYKQYLQLTDNAYFKIQRRNSVKENMFLYALLEPIELSSLIDKEVTQYTTEDKAILYWTSLFVILKAYKARAVFMMKEKATSIPAPTKKEALSFLFPLASTPLILPIHNGDETNFNRFMNLLFDKEKNNWSFEDLFKSEINVFDVSTRYLLRCYANSIGLTDKKYYPEWLY